MGLEESDAVVVGDGLLFLGANLGLSSSEFALSGLGAGNGSISLTTEGFEFLQWAKGEGKERKEKETKAYVSGVVNPELAWKI